MCGHGINRGFCFKLMEYPTYKREEKVSAKLSEDDIAVCCKMRVAGLSLNTIANLFNVSSSTIWRVTLSKEKLKELYKKLYTNSKESHKKYNAECQKKVRERKKTIKLKELKKYYKEKHKKRKVRPEYTKLSREYGRKYALKNKKKRLKYAKKYRDNNKNKIKKN